ncbi:translation initiation factor [Haloferax larsenii]|uniref:Protein translation factor SUI1 homolog n=1 Tax=Haloferax larsenii TaxID=302484 RepID=A0ABY5RCP0_HALLR|nr:translation initiation factor [Haloferax larsenii]ELZ81511.1 translation initiation factor 1 (eif-1/sui1) [Haloferax larsenii JCM 13917]UVE49929.1 translation initiation factor [Haloferax larsenii]
MSEDDPFDDLDIPDDPLSDLDRATQELTVRTETRRYGKQMVIIEGFQTDTDIDDLASDLKSALGTGGTVKDDRIEIQGDHEKRVRELLRDRGYGVENA